MISRLLFEHLYGNIGETYFQKKAKAPFYDAYLYIICPRSRRSLFLFVDLSAMFQHVAPSLSLYLMQCIEAISLNLDLSSSFNI